MIVYPLTPGEARAARWGALVIAVGFVAAFLLLAAISMIAR